MKGSSRKKSMAPYASIQTLDGFGVNKFGMH